MKLLRHALVILMVLTLFVSPGLGCSHEGSSAVFIQVSGPDVISDYVHGRLGVVRRTYRIRHMAVAYNILAGRPLTAPEQRAALAVDARYHNHGQDEPSEPGPGQDTGVSDWIKVSSGDDNISFQSDRTVPGEPYQTFTNCLGDAFTRAAQTLATLRSRYGKPGAADSPEIQDWIAGQHAVFSNCADTGQTPQPAPANAPLWLRQERAYQTAAARFYALDYPGALAGFQAIAADKSSPNAPLARYIVARVLIRQAQVPFTSADLTPRTKADQQAVEDRTFRPLQQARAQLQGILADPSMSAFHRQSRRLLDLVMIRLDPAAQAEELARRITETPPSRFNDATYRQAVIDLGYVYRALPMSAWPLVAHRSKTDPLVPTNPFLRWLDDMYGAENGVQSEGVGLDLTFQNSRTDAQRREDALDSWHKTHGQQWLVAALTIAAPADPDVPELIEAAKSVAASSPAFPAVTYHRLRLEMRHPASAPASDIYREVTSLLPAIERTQSRSTINLYRDTQATLAPTLEDFLKASPRLPASYTNVDGDENGAPGPDYPIPADISLCNVKVYAPDTPHLDTVGANILNQRMPLSLLRDAALSPILSNNLRLQIAHMAWTRALLLDQPEIAHSLTPLLSFCQPAFKPWLDAYDAASKPEQRHILGLLAMMRFTSTEPLVRVGGERDFAAYSEYRDNWWSNRDDNEPAAPAGFPRLFSQVLVSSAEQPDPPFLTDADRTQVRAELALLERIPGAADYFGQQTLDWVKAHPDDPHNPELLGFAMRVIRNGSRSNATAGINHQLFDILHRRYPASDWAAKYKTWE